MISIWLTFADNYDSIIKRQIRDLAVKYAAPQFSPHITLYGSLGLEASEIDKIVRVKFESFKPFFVTPGRVNQSDNIWQTIVMETGFNKSLAELNEFCQSRFNKYGPYKFEPHISLIYKKLSEDLRKTIISEVVPEERYLVSGISLVETSSEVMNWRILEKYNWVN